MSNPNKNSNDGIIIKYNGGLGAILCSSCRVIIKTGKDFSDEESAFSRGEIKERLEARYCDKCQENLKKVNERQDDSE